MDIVRWPKKTASYGSSHGLPWLLAYAYNLAMKECLDGNRFLKSHQLLLLEGGWKLEWGKAHAFVNCFLWSWADCSDKMGMSAFTITSVFLCFCLSYVVSRHLHFPLPSALAPIFWPFGLIVHKVMVKLKSHSFSIFHYVLSTWLLLCPHLLYCSRKDWLKYLFPITDQYKYRPLSAFLFIQFPEILVFVSVAY